MPAPSSRFYPSATCSLAFASSSSSSSRSPPRRRRRRRRRRSHASLMGQSPSAPPGRSRSRSSLRWPQPGLGFGFVRGFLLGRNKDERMDLANWMRCFLSQRLPAPSAEEEADAEGKAAGRCEGEEVGDQEADHLVVMVNGLYGSSADWKFAAEQFVKRLPGKVFVHHRDDGKSPLLVRMVDDCDDGKFMSALRSFKRRVAYANVTYDHIVGWSTSSIRLQHELPKLKLKASDEKYPHVINVEKGNSEDHLPEDSEEASPVDSLEG
nr:unnamed protein product [Digitaria exilis]